HQAVTPKVAVPNAEEKPVLAIAVQILLELGFVGLKIADRADHHVVLLFHFKHPQVVFDPRAGFDLNGSNDSQRRCQLAVARGQRGFRVSPSSRIGSALRPGLIEQVDVAIDDGNRRRLSFRWLSRAGDGRAHGGTSELLTYPPNSWETPGI